MTSRQISVNNSTYEQMKSSGKHWSLSKHNVCGGGGFLWERKRINSSSWLQWLHYTQLHKPIQKKLDNTPPPPGEKKPLRMHPTQFDHFINQMRPFRKFGASPKTTDPKSHWGRKDNWCIPPQKNDPFLYRPAAEGVTTRSWEVWSSEG